ncbi:MAG: alpha/beta hydrolase [Chitinophagaceae bacterium]
MRKGAAISIIVICLLLVVYMAGPSPSSPAYTDATQPDSLPAQTRMGAELEAAIRAKETQHKLKPDNEARIVWADDSLKNQTEYAIVYLHGFSASQEEGDPVHTNIAKKFGYNLYLSRLAEHGIDTTEDLINLTPDSYWNSAKEALQIGRQLGKKVILMGTSTGGSLAIMLAAAFPDKIESLILLSPNIAIRDGAARLLNNPWGLQIARMVKGSRYVDSKDQRPIYKQYWNSHYRLEGAVALEELLETSMIVKNFSKVKQPTLMLYYYKDDEHQDAVVSVEAMKKMFERLGTPAEQKRAVVMPNTGDHVIGSYIKSKDIEGVEREIELFLKEVVHLEPTNKPINQ